MKHNALLAGLLAVAILALGLPAISAAAEGGWHTSGELYIWMADANVTTTEGEDIEADFNDVIDELELGFMGTLGTRKDRWSWFGDLIFVAIDARETTPVSGPGIPGPIDADLKFEQDVLVITAGGGYSMSESDSHRVDFAFSMWWHIELHSNNEMWVLKRASASWSRCVGRAGQHPECRTA